MRKVLPVALAAMTLAAGASPAAAAGESEPNDDIAHPSGPLREGETHDGAFGWARDHDWFVLYTHPSRQLDLAITKAAGPDSCSSSLDARLLDADGRRVDSKTVDAGETDNIRQLTAPAPARYYLVLVTDCPPGTSGDPYAVAPVANGAVANSSPAEATRPKPDPDWLAEPNDDLVHAAGPLAGGVQYGGTTSTATDRDWLVFYTNPGYDADVALTKVGAGCSSTLDARLLDADGGGLQGTAVSSNETDHFRLATGAVAKRFYVEFSDTCAGDEYQLRVDPPAAVDPSSPLRATQPAPAAAFVREPNDRFARAFGPVIGGMAYGGAFRSARDVDHVLLYSAGPGLLDLSIAKVGRSCSSSIEARLFNPAGRLVKTGGPASDHVWHMRFRAPRATAYVLRLYSGCKGDPYQLRVDPQAGLRRSAPRLLSVQAVARRSYVASGHLLGRLGLRRAHLCPRIRARLEARRRGRLVWSGRARVRRDCSYSSRRIEGRGRLAFTATFSGHRAVAGVRARGRAPRAPRVPAAR